MYQKLLKKTVLLIGMIIITFAGVLMIPVRNSDHYLLAALDKEQRLHQLPSPKIVIIGGSNTVFNINSRKLETSTGLPVVNMGLHAGLGLMFMLNEIEDACNENDIVIIIPEYDQFYKEQFFGGRIVVRLLSFAPQLSHYITNRHQVFEIVKSLGLETRSKIVYLLGKSADEMMYNRSAFNEYGDIRSELVGSKPLAKLSKEVFTIHKIRRLNKLAINELNRYHQRMNQKGVSVFLAFSAVPFEKYPENSRAIRNLYNYLVNNLDIPILYSPKLGLLPEKYFFDTYYHLNTAGRNYFTKTIIKHLPISS